MKEACTRTARTVAVLGIDGSGKSTVSRIAAQRLSANRLACLVSDRLEFYENGAIKPLPPFELEAIRRMVSRFARSAGSLETYKIPKLVELLLRDGLCGEVDRWHAPSVIVLDGSPILNMAAWAALYAKGEIDDEMLARTIAVLAGEQTVFSLADPLFGRLPELRYLYLLGLTHMRLPRMSVLLDLPPSVACSRIASRGRPMQAHETEERLRELRAAYLAVQRIISERWRIPTLVVDAAQPSEQTAAAATQFLRESLEREHHDHEPSN